MKRRAFLELVSVGIVRPTIESDPNIMARVLKGAPKFDALIQKMKFEDLALPEVRAVMLACLGPSSIHATEWNKLGN